MAICCLLLSSVALATLPSFVAMVGRDDGPALVSRLLFFGADLRHLSSHGAAGSVIEDTPLELHQEFSEEEVIDDPALRDGWVIDDSAHGGTPGTSDRRRRRLRHEFSLRSPFPLPSREPPGGRFLRPAALSSPPPLILGSPRAARVDARF